MRPIFFYGLFMSAELLREQGLHPSSLGVAELAGYRLHIGARASLIRDDAGRCYGVLMDLPSAEAEALYAPADVRDYRAEEVRVIQRESGRELSALVYNLPAEALSAASNSDYARKLAELARELELPPSYVDEIAAFAAG